jgi:NitT/TauT family transport system permease protein
MPRLFLPIRRRQSVSYGVLAPIFVIIVWIFLSEGALVSPLFLPRFRDIGRQLIEGPVFFEWSRDFLFSTSRILAGFLLAAISGVPLGLYMGSIKTFDALLAPVIEMARYIPVPALLPLCILWFGVGETEKIAVIFIGTFFQIVASVVGICQQMPVEYIDVARTLGITEQRILWRVVWPASSKAIFELLRISLGWAWSYLVVAEIVAAGSGIGYRIMWSQRYLQVGLVFVGLLELAALGYLTDILFRRLKRRIFRW